MSSDKAPFEVLSGEPHIYEKLKDFKFRISADTFFQVKLVMYYFYRPQRSWGKVIFSEAFVKNPVHGGGGWRVGGHALVWQGDVHGRGACMAGGVHGRGYVWGGHVWQGGHAVAGGIHGRGCVWQGGMHGRKGGVCGIQSMSRRYASYWNAFLLLN